MDSQDSVDEFIKNIWNLSCKSKLLNPDNMENFKNNMETFINEVVDKTSKGASGFYCKVLVFIGTVSQKDQDTMMIILREIIDYCLEDRL